MSQPLVRADNPYSIFRLPEALTCWPAVSVMAASFLVAALVFALGGALARVWMGFTVLLALVAIVVGLAGISGAGACLSDLARKRPYRGLVGYFIAGLLCLPKLLGAGLLMMLAALALFLALAVVFFICKIPVLGPLLLVVVVPVAVLAMAALMLALYVASSIVGPALWDGERVMHSLSITWHITRKYPFAAIGKIVGGMLLSAIFASMLFGLITSASFTVGGLFAAVVGMGGDFGGGMGYGMRHGMGGGFNPLAVMMGSASGHVMGAGVGFSLVFALASAFVFLLPLMVGVLTWCEFSEKVDLDSIRQAADEKLQDMNNKMADLKEKAQVQAAAAAAAATAATQKTPAASPAAEQPSEATPAAPVAPTTAVAADPSAPAATAAPAAAPACPQCHGTVQVGDRFCEHCGHKLV
ncbi:zinc ribbon domain-containing protein [Acidovorax sp. IB03]|uniref:zinc ribbon domain-containing protein n=1 Tax=Acidovorax sp. IB03 TaxID=2779366 RepID=UPI0018E86BC6|nr:zinc ribbon domain-containing protein [Acidovorax sp. IB03]MBJ2165978.1 zinc ribbon domain-containing protein [Acidovorax sp. IB03]